MLTLYDFVKILVRLSGNKPYRMNSGEHFHGFTGGKMKPVISASKCIAENKCQIFSAQILFLMIKLNIMTSSLSYLIYVHIEFMNYYTSLKLNQENL